MKLDVNNFWLAFRIAAHDAQRKAIFRDKQFALPNTQSHEPNNWDYTKRIHRKGHGWKANHQS